MTEWIDPTELKRLCFNRLSGVMSTMLPLVIIVPSQPIHLNAEPTFQSETYSPPICLVKTGSVNTLQTFELGALISIDFSMKDLDMVPTRAFIGAKRMPCCICYGMLFCDSNLLAGREVLEYVAPKILKCARSGISAVECGAGR